MNGEVQLIVKNIGPATYTQWLNVPINVAPDLEKMYISADQSPNFICEESQLLLDTIQSQGGLTVQLFDLNDNSLGTAFLNTLSGYDIGCGGVSPQTTLKYDAAQTSIQVVNTAYFIWFAGTGSMSYILDLYENESISQNWKFQDLSNFTAQGAFSREFRIPFSETNKEALGALFDNNVEQGAENYFFYKLPAEIRVDTLPIATGYLRVRKVYKQMNRLSEVEVAFYAETPDLVRTIGEKKLSDIAALADLNEPVTASNVITETADRIWALCDRGQKWSNDGSTGSRPILNPNAPIFPADLTPAVSWWFLLRNIVTEAGFELVASSLENILNDYWMPFCNTPQLTNTNIPNEYFFRVYNSISSLIPGSNTYLPFEANTLIFDNGGNFNVSTYEYTVPVSGEYTFNGLLKIDGATVDANVSVNIGLIINVYPNITNYFNAPVAQGGTQYVPFTFVATLEQGDVVALAMTAVNESLAMTCLAGDGTVNSSFYEINSVNAYSGQTINYSANAPDMRQIDFVNDIIKMHNCAIVPSRIVPNQIAIIPQNNYIGTGDVVDWTGKLDISKDVMTSSTVDIQKATFQFTYTSGEDAYSKLYRDAGRVYGDFKQEGYTINPSTAPSDFAIGDQKITLVTRSAPAALIPGTGAPIQCFYNEQLEFVAPGPRALYNAAGLTVSLYNEVSGSAVEVVVPILNHYSAAYPNVDDYDLNWAPETPPHVVTVSANPHNNLFNLYWRNYMNEIYSPEGRIMEAFFALDLKDILTFSFADKVWIQDSYWRILEISDYKVGLQESTKVKLIKYLDQINDCSSTPVGVTANGEVEFESGGEAVEPNEDCCSRYGYFWDEINGVCWAFNNGGQFRNSIVSSNNVLNASSSNLFERFANATTSVIQGQKINVIDSNSNSLLVGENLTLNKSVLGSNLLGKNVLTNLPGLHIGGGYRAGLSTSTETGWAQFGQFVLQRYPTITTSGQVENLYIEGVVGEYIELPDETLWSCLLNVTIKDGDGLSEVSLHHFILEKIGGIASASAITTLNTIGAIGAHVFTFGINTTTNTDQHRINVTFTGGPYPEGFLITASLQYQQSKSI
jgi:hypothetical protein